MKILITGGAGYIGTVLTSALLNRGYQVDVLDLFWFGDYLPQSKNLRKIRKDVRQIKSVDISEYDLIFHFASVANDPCADLDASLCWDISVTSSFELADHAVKCGVKRVIYASSGSVYGIKEEEKVTEDLTLVPISVYNKAKIASERIFLSYKNDLNVQIIRPATVCGLSPRMRLDVAVNLLTMQALKNKSIKVLGGEQSRPNIHIMDLVAVYLYMIDNPNLRGIFNAGFENLKIIEIAKKIANITNAKINIQESNDPRSYKVDSSKLLKSGFSPNFGVDFAIDEIVKAYSDGVLKDMDECYNVNWMRALIADRTIEVR
jgi:nucleoside-diphosphate-sugar epimerase